MMLNPFANLNPNAGAVKPDAGNLGGGAVAPALLQHMCPAIPDVPHPTPRTAQMEARTTFQTRNGNAQMFQFYMPNNTPADKIVTLARAAVEFHLGTPGITILRVSIDC